MEPSVLPDVEETGQGNLEQYAHVLEMKLAMKSGLVDDAVRLQQSLGQRLAVLEQGLSWKDAQLQELSRHNEEVFRSAATWEQRAARLEEENCVLRDALLEHADLLQLCRSELSMEAQARQHLQLKASTAAATAAAATAAANAAHAAAQAAASSPENTRSKESEEFIENLKKQLKESNQKTLLLEEQLRIRSGADPLGFDAAPECGGAMQEFALLPPVDVWCAVGRGAADRICGVVPHSATDFVPLSARLRSCSVSEFGITSEPDEPTLTPRGMQPVVSPTADAAAPEASNGSTPRRQASVPPPLWQDPSPTGVGSQQVTVRSAGAASAQAPGDSEKQILSPAQCQRSTGVSPSFAFSQPQQSQQQLQQVLRLPHNAMTAAATSVLPAAAMQVPHGTPSLSWNPSGATPVAHMKRGSLPASASPVSAALPGSTAARPVVQAPVVQAQVWGSPSGVEFRK